MVGSGCSPWWQSTAVVLLLVGGAAWAENPLKQPPIVKRLDTTLKYFAGGESPVAECSLSATFSKPVDAQRTERSRCLCQTAGDGRIVLAREFSIGETGETKYVFADVASGQWLRITEVPNIEPRHPDEPWPTWRARLAAARPETVRVETNGFRLDPVRGDATGRLRPLVWERLEADQPELASRVRWVLEYFQDDPEGEFVGYVLQLTRLVYSGAKITQFEVTSKGTESRVSPIARPPTEFEKKFGKWADWPDLPVSRK